MRQLALVDLLGPLASIGGCGRGKVHGELQVYVRLLEVIRAVRKESVGGCCGHACGQSKDGLEHVCLVFHPLTKMKDIRSEQGDLLRLHDVVWGLHARAQADVLKNVAAYVVEVAACKNALHELDRFPEGQKGRPRLVGVRHHRIRRGQRGDRCSARTLFERWFWFWGWISVIQGTQVPKHIFWEAHLSPEEVHVIDGQAVGGRPHWPRGL
mmetsp:Transcript_24374/g.61088  ORF Transcript_24374/g.61088 Transcript_24374/m.61088 type:complete len:211 (+) Transcript_24374:1911-2543(+)